MNGSRKICAKTYCCCRANIFYCKSAIANWPRQPSKRATRPYCRMRILAELQYILRYNKCASVSLNNPHHHTKHRGTTPSGQFCAHTCVGIWRVCGVERNFCRAFLFWRADGAATVVRRTQPQNIRFQIDALTAVESRCLPATRRQTASLAKLLLTTRQRTCRPRLVGPSRLFVGF